VADQDNVVLGGLIDERVERSSTKIPLLGDLPLLGALFRSTRTSREKSNLLIVLTPYLIDDSLDGRELFARRMREREEFLRARSALSSRAAAPRVDYRKKRGVIAEIDARVHAVEHEQAARAGLATPPPPRGRVDEATPTATVTP
jgi:general secretion pathway protein D